jgi:hypothetical protein
MGGIDTAVGAFDNCHHSDGDVEVAKMVESDDDSSPAGTIRVWAHLRRGTAKEDAMKMKLFSISLAAVALGGGLAASTAFAQFNGYPDPVPPRYMRPWQYPSEQRNEQYNRNLATPGGGGTPSCAMTQNCNENDRRNGYR